VRILALITARGGSKRLPGKNVRLLGGKPLIVWSIDIAKDIPEICDIIVSTDDSTIAEVSINAGASVPWLRPDELATDSSSSVDVALHTLDWYEGEKGPVDALLLLQPTSPFRRRNSILRGIKLYMDKLKPVIGMSPAQSHPMWCYQLDGEVMRPFIEYDPINTPTQPNAYVINGSFYLIAPEVLRKKRSFKSNDMVPLIIEELEERIDIDTEWDWKLAETFLNSQELKK